VLVLSIAATAFAQSMVAGLRLSDAMRQRGIALEGARRRIEELQDANFAQVFALYDANPANDPGGAGTAPGANFTVDGLTPLANDADGMVGSITFPVSGTQLRENVTLRSLGMPHDLNGDGPVDAADHAADYQILPVLVRVSWRGPTAPMTVDLRTILSER